MSTQSPTGIRRIAIEKPQLLLGVLFALTLTVLPLVSDDSVISLLIFANILALFTLSWDVLAKIGEFSFGQSFFVGIGGYVSIMFTIYLDVPLIIAILTGVLVTVIVGVIIIGFPVLRLTGPYFSLVTLLAPLILNRAIVYFSEYTGGERGLIGGEILPFSIVGNFYLIHITLLVTSLLMVILFYSNVGYLFRAIAEDETATRSIGINTVKYKLFACALSAAIAGIGGAYLAHNLGTISPASHVDLSVAIDIVIAALIGGVGTVIGPIFGAYFLTFATQELHFLGRFDTLVYILLALVLVYKFPGGVYGYMQDNEVYRKVGSLIESRNSQTERMEDQT